MKRNKQKLIHAKKRNKQMETIVIAYYSVT